MTEILQFTFEKSKFTKILSKNVTTGLRSNIPKATEKWYVWKSPPPQSWSIGRWAWATSDVTHSSHFSRPHVARPWIRWTILIYTHLDTSRDQIVAKCYEVIPNFNNFLSLNIFVQTLDEQKYAHFKKTSKTSLHHMH
jgi:hypothetical protein